MRRCLAILLALLTLHPPGAAVAQDAGERQGKVEAAFLRNFARYVTWPTGAFPSERAPWSVCILDNDHFDDSLERTFQGRSEQGRSFEVIRASRLEQLPACQILFVGYRNDMMRRAVLAKVKRQPVLTVGNAPEFLSEGGIVRLLAGERIEMSINLDQARAASLTIPAKILEVARDVVEDGAVRKWR